MMRRRYVPDLSRLGAVCDGNYVRLSRLIRLCREVDGDVQFELHDGQRFAGRVRLQRLQQARYTDTWLLEQIQNNGRWLNNPRMTVRSYHDARMTEVISCYRYGRIEAVHDYPNRFMHHPDEKMQTNVFLADWLDFCLRFGKVAGMDTIWTVQSE